MEGRVSLLEMARIIAANRKVVILSVLLVALLSIGLALVLPKWYNGVALILPPESDVGQSNMVTMMRLAGYRPGVIPAVTGQSDVYAAILGSDTVVDGVIERLDLIRAYKAAGIQGARDRVRECAGISVTGEGLVRVEYEDRDEARAVSVANEFVKELDRFTRESMSTSASRVRQFIEGRLAETSSELDRAQNDLKAFKESTGAVLIAEQAGASIKAAAEIYGKIAALEVSLARVLPYATEKSPEVVDIRSQIRALERKLAEMGYMGAPSDEPSAIKLFPRFSSAPELERRLGDLMAQVEIKRSVYAALAEQYEAAKISEARDTPTIQVLAWAKQPLIRSKPRRRVIVVTSTVSALVVACLAVLWRERLRTAGASREREVLGEIRGMLASDLRAAGAVLRGNRRNTGS